MNRIVGLVEKSSKCARCYTEGFPCFSCKNTNVSNTTLMSWEEFVQIKYGDEPKQKNTYEKERIYAFYMLQDSEANILETHQDRFEYLIIRALVEQMYKYEKYEAKSFDIIFEKAKEFETHKCFQTWGITGRTLEVYLRKSYNKYPECINQVNYLEILEKHKIKPHFVDKFMHFISLHEDKLHLII